MSYYPFTFSDEAELSAFVSQCENRFRTRLVEVAGLAASHPDLRFLLLAGPTCSGKTTTANILTDRLERAGHRVILISIDDFFYDRPHLLAIAQAENAPLDLDSVKAIDLSALKRTVSDLLAKRTTVLPRFDFTDGMRKVGQTIEPHPEDVYLLEGIQAVYPEVTALFPQETVLSLYISVEETVETPFGIWQPRDLRLLRRLLRDSLFRNTNVATTFAHWGGVVRNELRSIEPYKDGCDITIDSTMPYELGVLRDPLLHRLGAVLEGDDHAVAARLLSEKLAQLPSLPAPCVPADSVLREFIGADSESERTNPREHHRT